VSASSASFEIRSARAWRVAVLAGTGLGLLSAGAWAATLLLRGEPAMLPAAAGAAIVCLLAATARVVERGRLRWDGATWLLSEQSSRVPPERAGTLSVAFDFGAWMLLRFREDGRPAYRPGDAWLAVASRDMPAQWLAFRRAVYSPRPDPAGPSAQAPADPPA
jgi:hypothetical protein